MRYSKWVSITAAALLALAGAASHALVIGFSPSAQVKSTGQTADVDIVLSGLTAETEIVSGFIVDVSYTGDPTVQFVSGEYGTGLGNPTDFGETFVLFDPPTAAGGVIGLGILSFLSDAALDALQGDSVVLATLHFLSNSAITTTLSISYTDGDITGRCESDCGGPNALPSVLSPTAETGSITWESSGPRLPIPGTALLLAAGLLGMLGIRRVRG